MYNEISFLFGSLGDSKGGVKPLKYDNDNDAANILASKRLLNTEDSYAGSNDLLKVINHFSATGKGPSAGRLKPFVISYMKDLGVYPINRMVILRRFADGTEVTDNLWDMEGKVPERVIVGFLPHMDEDLAAKFSFGETWSSQNKMLHEVLQDIMTNEFGLSGFDKLAPLPGWSQGFLFGFLRKLAGEQNVNINDGTIFEVPLGDPNMIKDAATRDGLSEQTNLKSSMQFNFKVTWEQKFIGNMEPSDALFGTERGFHKKDSDSILREIMLMGTSQSRFVLSNLTGSSIMHDFTRASLPTLKPSQSAELWKNATIKLVDVFVDTLKSIFNSLALTLKWSPEKSPDPNQPAPTVSEKETAEGVTKFVSNQIGSLKNTFIVGVVAATLYKHRWSINSSVKLMTGAHTAPWHLTIGDPFNPIISVGNIVVEDVDLTMSNELAYNNMPTELKADFKCRLGRTLGAQELYNIFNHSYIRKHNTEDLNIKNDDTVVVIKQPDTPPKSGTIKVNNMTSGAKGQSSTTTDTNGNFALKYDTAIERETTATMVPLPANLPSGTKPRTQ